MFRDVSGNNIIDLINEIIISGMSSRASHVQQLIPVLIDLREHFSPPNVSYWTSYPLTSLILMISPHRRSSWISLVIIIQTLHTTRSSDRLSAYWPPSFTACIAFTSPVSHLLDKPLTKKCCLPHILFPFLFETSSY